MTNLRLGYEVSDSIQLSLDLLNLFDSDDHDVEYFYPSQLIGEPDLWTITTIMFSNPDAASLSAVSALMLTLFCAARWGLEREMTNFKALT